MDAITEFACTWSSVGGPFDDGGTLDRAKQSKIELRALVESLAVDASILKFAGLVLQAHQNDGYPGDVDGDFLQQTAVECGLLQVVQTAKRCGEHCTCAEMVAADEWPVECYCRTALGQKAVDAARTPPIAQGAVDAPDSEGGGA